jgi:hypothetical protein
MVPILAFGKGSAMALTKVKRVRWFLNGKPVSRPFLPPLFVYNASANEESAFRSRSPEAGMIIHRNLLKAWVALASLSTVQDLYSQTHPVRVRLIVVSSAGWTEESVEEIMVSKLIGDYRLGDGLGYNLHLVLKTDGRFACTWRGCLGVYGSATGTWAIQAAGIKLSSQMREGKLKELALDRLRVISFSGHYLLLREEDRDWFKEHGPDRFLCFHREEAREPLEQRWREQVKATVKPLEEKSKKTR